jgi:hypothetical protein
MPYDPRDKLRTLPESEMHRFVEPLTLTAALELKEYLQLVKAIAFGTHKAGDMWPDSSRAECSVVISGVSVSLDPWVFGSLLQGYAGLYDFFMARKKRFPTAFPLLVLVEALGASTFPFYLRVKVKPVTIGVRGPPVPFEWVQSLTLPLSEVRQQWEEGPIVRMLNGSVGGLEFVCQHREMQDVKIRFALYAPSLTSSPYLSHGPLGLSVRPIPSRGDGGAGSDVGSSGRGAVTHTVEVNYTFALRSAERPLRHVIHVGLTGLQIEVTELECLDMSGLGKVLGDLGAIVARDAEFGELPATDSVFPHDLVADVDLGDTQLVIVRNDEFIKPGEAQKVTLANINIQSAQHMIVTSHTRRLEKDLRDMRGDHEKLIRQTQLTVHRLEADLLEHDRQLVEAKMELAFCQSDLQVRSQSDAAKERRLRAAEAECVRVRQQNMELFDVLDKSKALDASGAASRKISMKQLTAMIKAQTAREAELSAAVENFAAERANYVAEVEQLRRQAAEHAAHLSAADQQIDAHRRNLADELLRLRAETEVLRTSNAAALDEVADRRNEVVELMEWAAVLEARLAAVSGTATPPALSGSGTSAAGSLVDSSAKKQQKLKLSMAGAAATPLSASTAASTAASATSTAAAASGGAAALLRTLPSRPTSMATLGAFGTVSAGVAQRSVAASTASAMKRRSVGIQAAPVVVDGHTTPPLRRCVVGEHGHGARPTCSLNHN